MDKKIIFLLDDDAAVCEVYKLILEGALPEIEVYTFTNYKDFKKHSLLSKASLFIYDINLDGKNGDEIAMEIIKINPAPVLFISGVGYDFESFSLDQLTYDFIIKPHDMALIVNRVKLLLMVSEAYKYFRNDQDQSPASLNDSIESIRKYWKQAIEDNRATLKANKSIIKAWE